ncbi:MAG: pyridoxal 5'-phosphate synthase glutaminase subunit PdxT [Candidatus Micrarchaeota archaeon]|nr:pyridoxal 5'-phosphate synthase glutaminase subunit PdxT [Candidatus Micrarchaeota archaeon]
MKIGVLGMQGAVSEHMHVVEKLGHSPVWVRNKGDLEAIRALIIPGGESTTISKLVELNDLYGQIRRMGQSGFPIFGTCAGLILLAKKGDGEVKRTGQKLLGLMDTQITRNAFGRQRESFEIELDVGKMKNFPCVFIRAPAITKTFGKCKPLAKFEKFVVAAEQGNLLATSFHPELTEDTRVHEYFIEKI